MNSHLYRQIDHWRAATHRLRALESIAAPAAWAQLEHHTDIALRSRLTASINTLQAQADRLADRSRRYDVNRTSLRAELQQLRKQYMRTEMTLDYFGDAINTRTEDKLGRHLAALDEIAETAIRRVLQPLGHRTPPVMTYIDKGLGASVLKAGLQLWDQRGANPVAVIKIVRHNIYRPTALIHEAGHQISYMIDWNRELAEKLKEGLSGFGSRSAAIWAGWASEIAADAFAFALTGYSAIATLQDVLSGGPGLVFQFHSGAPHPTPYLRTLLGVAMCREAFGPGPWDGLEKDWREAYPLTGAPKALGSWLAEQEKATALAVKIILRQPMRAFGGRSLLTHLPVTDLHPARLSTWGASLGPVHAISDEVVRKDTLRLLALSVYQQVTESSQADRFRREMDQWFTRIASRRMYTQNQFA